VLDRVGFTDLTLFIVITLTPVWGQHVREGCRPAAVVRSA
jgi:hypothetical protein